MKVCPGCRQPSGGSWCSACRRKRFPQRSAYADPAYKALRARVLAGRPACWICGAPGADTIDHVIPLGEGGTNEPGNLRPAHRACNTRKANQ